MIDVGVDAARRDEAEQVDGSPALPGPREGRGESGVVEDGAGPQSDVDPHQILEQDAPGADRQMAHFGVAHLPFRKAHGLTRCCELSCAGTSSRALSNTGV